ncbi:MAG TPA: hypothetical protein VJN18_22845 [Polyangiaceae bacterium]|nr:hypothetical protein [Polyangiaceae bacterium]
MALGTASASSSPTPSQAKPFRECGELSCKAFPTAVAAFDHVLAQLPRMLAIGEAHAQRTGPKVSTVRRFMDEMLPRLAPRASDLVIELAVPPNNCAKVEKQVRKQTEAVTAPQASTNQNEYFELGKRAKELSIQPHALSPSCEQLKKITEAGADDVLALLSLVRDLARHDISQLLTRRAPDRLIVAYGGGIHNDLAPREGRQELTFGPELAKLTGDRYIELDLVIPEQIKDSDVWRALPWYPHYSPEKAGSEAYLLSWSPRAYVLLFPKEPAP